MKGHFGSGLWQLVLIDDYTAKAVHEGSVHYLRTRAPGDLSAVCQPAAADEWLGPAPWCGASRQLRLCSALWAALLQCSCLSPVTRMCTHRAMGSFHPGRAGLQIFILYNEWGYQWQISAQSLPGGGEAGFSFPSASLHTPLPSHVCCFCLCVDCSALQVSRHLQQASSCRDWGGEGLHLSIGTTRFPLLPASVKWMRCYTSFLPQRNMVPSREAVCMCSQDKNILLLAVFISQTFLGNPELSHK